jgi:Flp pilus assembly pilin Flp
MVMNGFRRLLQRDHGAAAIEFALVVPLLLMLLLGIVSFGFALNAHVTLTQASREGVRALALKTGDGITETKAAAVGLDPTKVIVTPTPCPASVLPSSRAQVYATYQVPLTIPFYSGPTSIDLKARAVMRCGG